LFDQLLSQFIDQGRVLGHVLAGLVAALGTALALP
jgi:hypothetical protein